ncbi:MAG: hypothetical protein U1F71_18455 [Verrucomicrobiaceae bacterium]
MTGTKDVARIASMTIGASDVFARLGVYPALPPGESGQRNPNHHRVILTLSTTFWDAFVKGDAEAKAWLNGEGPRAVRCSGNTCAIKP